MFRKIFLHQIASELGLSAVEIGSTERLEQLVYDMAQSVANFAPFNFTNKARFDLIDHDTHVEFVYTAHHNFMQQLATFYNKYFPTTLPEYVCSMNTQSIIFERDAFVLKVLPAINLWRNRPSCVFYVDSKNRLLRSSLNPGFGNAVFITGADSQLGKWTTATRLNYNETNQSWEFNVPAGVALNEFKFLTGAFELGQTVSISSGLTYETGLNKIMMIQPPSITNRETPPGMVARC